MYRLGNLSQARDHIDWRVKGFTREINFFVSIYFLQFSYNPNDFIN